MSARPSGDLIAFMRELAPALESAARIEATAGTEH
jgi:hypothetical protein